MKNEAMARELVKLAKELVADYGDVMAYYNIFDYFEAEGRKLESDEILLVQGMLEGALGATYRQRTALVRKAILSDSRDMKELSRRGIKVKK